MKQQQDGVPAPVNDGTPEEQARASAASTQEPEGPAGEADEGKVQKAASEVRDILKNSRHS